jgi:hypothetical protein
MRAAAVAALTRRCLRDSLGMRRVATVVALCAVAAIGVVSVRDIILTPGTTHFRGREFENSGFCHAGASRRYRVPIEGWPGLSDGERAFAIQTVRTAFPTDVLVLTHDGRCVSQWGLEGGP